MKSSFSIGEISDLLNIPKSTLRYWESVGLINMPRDDLNNYRKYNPSSIYTISDLAHFRCLRMPLQEMKKLPQLTPNELADSLLSLDHDLDDRLNDFLTAKEYINKKMLCINEYKKLFDHQYGKETPDYNSIYTFSMDDNEAWSIYIKDQYQSVLLFNVETDAIETGLAVSTMENHPKIWRKDEEASYVSFILKVGYSNPKIDDFKPHIDHLNKAGFKVSNIFARYLFSANDNEYYDFYKAFAEVYT